MPNNQNIYDNLIENFPEMNLVDLLKIQDNLPNVQFLPQADAFVISPYAVLGKAGYAISESKGNLPNATVDFLTGDLKKTAQYTLMVEGSPLKKAAKIVSAGASGGGFGIMPEPANPVLSAGAAGIGSGIALDELAEAVTKAPNTFGFSGIPINGNRPAGPLTRAEHIAAQLENIDGKLKNGVGRIELRFRSSEAMKNMLNPIKPGQSPFNKPINTTSTSTKLPGLLDKIRELRGGSKNHPLIIDLEDEIFSNNNSIFSLLDLLHKYQKRIIWTSIIGSLLYIGFKKRRFINRFIKKLFRLLIKINKFLNNSRLNNGITRRVIIIWRCSNLFIKV